MIVSLFTDSITVQTAVFLITSTALLFLTKPFVKKISRKDKVQTNAYSVIGKTGIVTKEINMKKGLGQIKVGSEVWSAKTTSEDIIPIGTEIEVIEIEGVKAVVKTVNVAVTK